MKKFQMAFGLIWFDLNDTFLQQILCIDCTFHYHVFIMETSIFIHKMSSSSVRSNDVIQMPKWVILTWKRTFRMWYNLQGNWFYVHRWFKDEHLIYGQVKCFQNVCPRIIWALALMCMSCIKYLQFKNWQYGYATECICHSSLCINIYRFISWLKMFLFLWIHYALDVLDVRFSSYGHHLLIMLIWQYHDEP